MEKEKTIIDAEVYEGEVISAEEAQEEIVLENLNGRQVIKKGDKRIIRVNGEDIVTYGPNGEVLECSLPRVDLDDTLSIINYGNEYNDSIVELLNGAAELLEGADNENVTQELIASIPKFNTEMQEAAKKREKNDNLPAIVKTARNGAIRLANVFGITKFAEEKEEISSIGCYRKYRDKLDEVSDAMMKVGERAKKDVIFRKATINQMYPSIHKLEEAITIGEYDKAMYDAKTLEYETDTNNDFTSEVNRRNNLSTSFEIILGGLRKNLSNYKQQIDIYREQDSTDSTIMTTVVRWSQSFAPILKTQASVAFYNYRQQKDLELLSQINAAGNMALQENAKNLNNNARKAVDLAVNGGITMETIQLMQKAIEDGVSIIEKGSKDLQAKIAKDKEVYKKITDAHQSFQYRLNQLAEENALSFSEGENTPALPYVKTIGKISDGYRKGNK